MTTAPPYDTFTEIAYLVRELSWPIVVVAIAFMLRSEFRKKPRQ